MKHNADIHEKRVKRLERDGAFRVEEPTSKFTRGFKPRFSDEVYKVASIDGGKVVDESGNKRDIKFVQAVPINSKSITSQGRFARTGSAQTEIKRQHILGKYAKSVEGRVRRAGGTLELLRVGEPL